MVSCAKGFSKSYSSYSTATLRGAVHRSASTIASVGTTGGLTVSSELLAADFVGYLLQDVRTSKHAV